MKSMTGYGKAVTEFENKTLSVELRTLNSKQADINIRIPNIYRSVEIEIQNIIKQRLERGKIDCYITQGFQKGAAVLDVNEQLFGDYYMQLCKITDTVGADRGYLTEFLLSRDDINQPVCTDISAEEKQALDEVDTYRKTEGGALEKAFNTHINNIEEFARLIEPFEKDRVPQIKEKLMGRFKELNVEVPDESRLEQELIFYLEKLDITEERVRLAQHIQYFRETMQADGTMGKRLGFIAQEMGREINTLGSKSNDVGMQKLVVMMKDELEKIKEQSANVL